MKEGEGKAFPAPFSSRNHTETLATQAKEPQDMSLRGRQHNIEGFSPKIMIFLATFVAVAA